MNISKTDFKLLGITSLFVASKNEEIYYPNPEELLNASKEIYLFKEMKKMEFNILKNLKYEVLTASPYQFLTILIQGISEDLENKDATLYLSQYILELSLLDYKMLEFPSSVKACSAIYIARKLLKFKQAWSQELKAIFKISDSIIKKCAKELMELINFANKTTLKNCKRKYEKDEKENVAKIIQEFS